MRYVKTSLLAMIAVSVALCWRTTHALEPGETVPSTPPKVTVGEKLRVDQAFLTVQNDGSAILEFQAASLDAKCELGGLRSSWLFIALTDADGNQLGPMKNAEVAQVAKRGDVQNHKVDITEGSTGSLACPISASACDKYGKWSKPQIKRAKGFKMQIMAIPPCS
jgi:hypothetical protein